MTDIDHSPGDSAIPDKSNAEFFAETQAEIDAINAQISADELEARTLKYTKALSIVPLSSGRYALFLPFSNEDGMPLAFIGDWHELEKPLREYREPERVVTPRKLDAINLDELFGDLP